MVEVMVVIAIIAILSMLAYPAYLTYTRKAVRTNAAALLFDVAALQQNHLIVQRKYALDWTFMNQEGAIPESRYSLVRDHYAWPPTIEGCGGRALQGTPCNGIPPWFKFTLIPSSELMSEDGAMCIDNVGRTMRYCGTAQEQVWYDD